MLGHANICRFAPLRERGVYARGSTHDIFGNATPPPPVMQQATALEVYDEFFGGGTKRIVDVTLDILEERLSP